MSRQHLAEGSATRVATAERHILYGQLSLLWRCIVCLRQFCCRLASSAGASQEGRLCSLIPPSTKARAAGSLLLQRVTDFGFDWRLEYVDLLNVS